MRERNLDRMRRARVANPDKYRESTRRAMVKYRANMSEDEKRQKLEYDTEWKRKNPYQTKLNNIKYKFGITKEEYETMVEEQGNRCAICQIKMSPPCIDHCHSTDKVRGLLCRKCNIGLGYFDDSIKYMRRAIKYLK